MKTLLCTALLASLSFGALAEDAYRWRSADGVVHYSFLPPPKGARDVQVFKPGTGSVVESEQAPYATRKAAGDHPVTLYTSKDCVEECKGAREFLARRGIPYSELMLATQEDIAGFRKVFSAEPMVPAVTVGNAQKMRGFQPEAWTQMLDLAGYAKAPARPVAAGAAGQ